MKGPPSRGPQEALHRGRILYLLVPPFVPLISANINREGVKNMGRAGFRIPLEEKRFSVIFKYIFAEN